MADSANTLIAAATALGYDTLSTRAIMESLLYAVSNGGGGGGGGGSVEQGNGAPVAIPADPLSAAIYVDLATNIYYTWNVATQTWVISSTGGSAQNMSGNGSPVGVVTPADVNLSAVYYDLDTGTFYGWRIVEQEWF
jgi:hypothetical protein